MRALVLSLVVVLVAGAAAGCLSSEEDRRDTEPLRPGGSSDSVEGQPANVTWGALDEAEIRPGASLGGYCTFNWLFTDAHGNAYIGTAGHCTEKLEERVSLGADGPKIGTVVYDSDVSEGADPAVDFSLVLLDPEQVSNAHPAMLGWEGPSGAVTTDDLAVGDEVALHGYGVLLGQNPHTRDRSGALVDWDDRLYRADMPAVNGDSGSPLLHLPTGKALGIISHYGLGATPPSTDEGPIMPFIFRELENAGFHVELATPSV